MAAREEGRGGDPGGRTGCRPTRGYALLLTLLVIGLLTAAGCAPDGSSPTTGGTAAPPPGSPTSTTSGPAPAKGASTTTASSAPSTTEPSPSSTRPTAPPSVPSGVAGREFERLPTSQKVIALTFDAAYEPAPLKDILRALKEGGATGTFFLTGEFVKDFPAEVERISAAGFPIGNHSYSHPDFRTLSEEKMRSQLSRTADLLAAAGVPDPRPLFRFPYGGRDQRTLAAVGRAGYASIYWTVDTLDWKPERTAAQIRSAVLDGLRPGAIVLMHVGGLQTARVLPTLIQDLKERGYRFVTIPEGLALGGE